ncbi:MAG: bifunctional adenosylcobinamide kinase/adenosylcobinamide-phosphate guanylyltransferase [Synergistaceae bacterium]|nr:bifunctional adenosylcobinamide kinase/adenosylcobinamide-phosphate guanylyltransferase [Synergistaceae bacterium]
MHLILGGRYQGKLSYANKLYTNFPAVYDLEREHPESINTPGLIMNMHLGVRRLLAEGTEPYEFFGSRLDILRESVIIVEEICGGIVPADEFLRRWRDETGRICQLLASEAEIVDRVFAGLAVRLKGGGRVGLP